MRHQQSGIVAEIRTVETDAFPEPEVYVSDVASAARFDWAGVQELPETPAFSFGGQYCIAASRGCDCTEGAIIPLDRITAAVDFELLEPSVAEAKQFVKDYIDSERKKLIGTASAT